jgi:hypothetical protein
MKSMKVLVMTAVILLVFSYPSSAQEQSKQKNKLFDIWVVLNKEPYTMRGVLYDIKDSSILVSDSKYKIDYLSGNFNVKELNCDNLSLVKIRRVKSVQRGAIIGAISGFSLLMIPLVSGDAEMPFLYAAFFYGIPAAVVGGGIGALPGLIKITIPIGMRYENFDRNKSKLQNFAYIKDNDFGRYEHDSYIGMLMGPSFPLGNFSFRSSGARNIYSVKLGYSSNVINLNYKIKPSFGISFLAFNDQYDVGTAGSDIWWAWTGFLIGPFFSFPLTNRLSMDIKPRFGSADASIELTSDYQSSGSGIVVNPCISFRYNFAKRWCALTEAGYITSSPDVLDIGKTQLQAINLDFGVGYRFR